ncbi:hypothetical protein NKH48_18240, partial [Mesorhizobium sp. M1233]|uniref:hypothetical protein n=1 Tax=Mesorhizobium sp. M1233 TaxID=2957072 RepID=UPI003339F9CA
MAIRLFDAVGFFALDLVQSATGGNDELLITSMHAGQQFTGTLKLGVKLPIPPEVIDHPANKLKTWGQIQADIKKLRDDSDFAAAELREAARDALRDALASTSLDVGARAGAFVGIDGLPLAGAAAVEARVVIDLLALYPTVTLADDTPVLTAILAAQGAVMVGGAARGAGMRVELILTRGGLIDALPSLSIGSLPQFPALDFKWPRIAWPKLSWPSIDLSGLARLLRFDLPLPKIGGVDSPLRIAWKPGQAPQFQVSLNGTQLAIATSQAGNGDLKCATGATTEVTIAAVTGFGMTLAADGAFAVTGTVAATPEKIIPLPDLPIEKPDLLPFTIDIQQPTLTIQISADVDLANPAPNTLQVIATLDFKRVLIRAKSDPTLLLALGATYRQDFDVVSGQTSGRLTRLDVVEPYPIKLVALAAQGAADAAQALMRLLASIRVPKPGAPDFDNIMALLDRIADMIAAAARWLMRQAGAVKDALIGVAEAVGELLAKMLKFIREALSAVDDINGPNLVIEVRLDSRSFALRQIMISPGWAAAPPAEAWKAEALGLSVEIPFAWTPALLVDFDRPFSVALLAVPQGVPKLKIGTDLWLTRDSAMEAVRDTNDKGERPEKRLIEIEVGFKNDLRAIAILRHTEGKVSFLQGIRNTKGGTANLELISLPNPPLNVVQVKEPVVYDDVDFDWLDIDVKADEATKRLLPFLQGSKETDGPGFLDGLGQYIQVKPGKGIKSGSTIALPFHATLKIGASQVDFDLIVSLDLKTFEVRLKGSDQVDIYTNDGAETATFDLLGLSGTVTGASTESVPPKYALFTLDFSEGDVRLALAKGAHIDLTYGKVASSGRGIVFRVDQLAMSRGGLDLDARVDPNNPVQLAGVDMPFRFADGALSVKRSQIQAFSITGAGQLPPELIGEANATITVSMGRDKSGNLIVQSAKANLDKSDDPIVCHATRFTFTLSAIGLEFQDFSGEGSGYHFYFTLTGSAEFRPQPNEFTDGLLKNLGGVSIKLDKAPLARDPSLLLRAIEFQVAIEPKKTFNVFNLFTFELRGIGFHPASPAFDGAPALSISGQVKFVEAGDVISPKFDFHKLWIAPPKPRDKDKPQDSIEEILDRRPRIRFDGLTLGVRFGNAMSIEGTAIAVDDSLPSLFRPGALSKEVTAKGFLASGKLSIKGWASMAASMGFLELRRPDGQLRHAFYLYIQQEEISIEIPTPVGPIYLREVGFGFGFRYTLAAFKAADQVKDIKGLIKVLDEISKYQGDLHSFRAWEPEETGNRLTLALRGLISIATASEENKYNAKGEKELPNPILFDVVLALRSDLTFFMNARAWLCFNYADWHDSGPHDPWRTSPTFRGYIYLSVPRREFLGRLIADGKGEVGKHPQLPKPLIDAMKGVQWSATTYIRPGLFHQEFGWPYELKFAFRESNYGIECQGGMIQRIEDGAMLYGIAFKAIGYARFGGSVGGRSFGASVMARADFSIAAKYIAYVSLTRFKDTLFYGSLAFDVTIGLEVRVWLRFKVFSKEIKIEIGFSFSLTISIGLEAAVSPEMIAARGSASVGISAFGRSVRLGIGFSINGDGLAAARARVERFLALGLTVDTPDPEKGAAPQAEPPRGPKAVEADHALDEQIDKHEQTKEQPGKPMAEGRDLQPTGYWAMLFPVAGETGRFVMTFVPRDHSDTGLEGVLPTHSETGGQLSTFYPPPFSAAGAQTAPLRLGNVQSVAQIDIEQLKFDGTRLDFPVRDNAPLVLDDNVVARGDGAGETMRLSRFLGQCFVPASHIADPDTPVDPTKLSDVREPKALHMSRGRERLPDSEELAAQVLAEAGRDQLGLNADQRWATELEERRSAAVASFCESAARLAAGGETAWSTAAKENLDVRYMGLAFLVTRTELDKLFAPDTPDGLPRPANFDLLPTETSIGRLDELKSVHLFNPPARMFRERRPRFAEPLIEARPTGIRLDWDLEPAFGRSGGVWHDPEYNLKHYRIERKVTRPNELDSLLPARSITTKSAAPLRLARNAESGLFEWRFLRPNAQFVDDLSDLSAGARAAILPNTDDRPAVQPSAADDPVLHELLDSKKDGLVLRYVVVPVDTAGTSGTPAYLSLPVHAKKKRRPSVKRAVLTFEYVDDYPIRDIGQTQALEPRMLLGIQDPYLQDSPKDGEAPLPPHRYTLRVRKERGAAAGLYGSDAVTDARVRPSSGDFALKRKDDEDFELIANALPASFDEPGIVEKTGARWKFASGTSWITFLGSIGVNVADRARKGPLGVRFAIRPLTAAGEAEPSWTTVDIMMVVQAPNKRPAVASALEIFEHPVSLQSAPLLADDMTGDAGRVLVLQPPESGLLKDLLGENDSKRPARARDPARRVATRLRWNARPVTPDPVAAGLAASHLASFIAGFDIAEIDVGAEAEGATSAPAVAALRYRFHAATGDSDPGPGVFRLNALTQKNAQALFIDLKDVTGVDQTALLDTFLRGSGAQCGQFRLVAAADASKWIGFNVTRLWRPNGYRRFDIECTGTSGDNPLAANSEVHVIYTRDAAARPVARVQALPASLARLDPAEISDFAKVEAHYPSERHRTEAAGPARQAPWYSAAESYLEWPQRTLRRSLAINVDETVVTELLSHGRPDTIVVNLTIPVDKEQPVTIAGDAISRHNGTKQNNDGFPLDADSRTAAGLRKLLQDIVWDADRALPENAVPKDATVSVTVKRATLTLHTVSWPMDLDPAMHPVLADVIDWARYEQMPAASLPRLKLAIDSDGVVQQAEASIEAKPYETFTIGLANWPASKPLPELVLRRGRDSAAITKYRLSGTTSHKKAESIADILALLATRLDASTRAALQQAYKEKVLDLSALRLDVMLRGGGQSEVISFAVDTGTLFAEPPASVYRRYEPVIEPLPKSAATDVAQWLSETPTQRDLYGWGILRSLGLAVGLRLYDTERRDYAEPRETLTQLGRVFNEILPRYAGLKLGAPFVDLITRAGGTMSIASFDGGTPETSADDVRKLFDEDALALTQVALRPVADRLSPAADYPIAYYQVCVEEKIGVVRFNVDALATAGRYVVADVVDLTSGLATQPAVTLVDKALVGDEKLCKGFAGEPGDRQTYDLVVPRVWHRARPVALVRLTFSDGNAAGQAAAAGWITGGEAKLIENPGEAGGPEPFGRFPQMSPERFANLASLHSTVKTAVETFAHYASRRFPGGWPQSEQGGLVGRLPDWCVRFLDHGPAAKPGTDVLCAIAEVTRPDPWRVGIGPDGRMEVLFTHEDRKRRLKRYAVKPFARYDNFVEAVRLADAPDATQSPHDVVDTWSDYVVVPPTKLDEVWSDRFFDVVIPRTEPVAPPVLLDARRIEILPPEKGKAPQRVVEFLYARHPEEILSEANVAVEGALSFESIAVGLWREFPMENWAKDLVPAIDTTEEFGSWEQPVPPPLITSEDKFGELARYDSTRSNMTPVGRYTDGWRGTLALRTDSLPYFYRTHAAPVAAAGGVVSKPVVGSIPEGHYERPRPWVRGPVWYRPRALP